MHDTRTRRSAAVEPARSRHTAPSVEANEPEDTQLPCKEQVTHKRSGLCPTCTHANGCTFPFLPGRPVLKCEEFEGVRCAATACAVTSEGTTADAQSEAEATSHHKGLCRTCEHRDVCTFSKPEGGVWHCDEFE